MTNNLRIACEDQKVYLVGVRKGKMTRRQMESSLSELSSLVRTAGGLVVGSTSQEIRRVDPATFIGKGKVEEIARDAMDACADIVAIDEELSPGQNRNLEKELGLLVLARTAIILDIFALRAKSADGKLQVELAQLRYLAPRLVGRGETLSQQAGRIGTRGPGETALEYDRRAIKEKITVLGRRLAEVREHRRIQRVKRESIPLPLVSLVGYTNAGKTTLMNTLTGSDLFVEDKLFATLDPAVRRLKLPSGREILIADTVGFIRRLPHQLVEAFKSTFEEVSRAHLIVHVIDGSSPEAGVEFDVVESVLGELGLSHKPRVDAINKSDKQHVADTIGNGGIKISALKGFGTELLLKKLDELLRVEFRRIVLRLPVERGDILSTIYRLGHVIKVDYDDAGVLVDCELHVKYFGKYRRYAVDAL